MAASASGFDPALALRLDCRDTQVPLIAELYRSAALRCWLDELTGERLQLSAPDDPHAYVTTPLIAAAAGELPPLS